MGTEGVLTRVKSFSGDKKYAMGPEITRGRVAHKDDRKPILQGGRADMRACFKGPRSDKGPSRRLNVDHGPSQTEQQFTG